MEQLLTPSAFDFKSKLQNVLLTFLFHLVLYSVIGNFVQFLFTEQFYPAPPIKYMIFSGSILAPLWEELAFRVIPITIANTLNKKLLVPIILLSSIIFGLRHGSSLNLLFQGVMGVAFSILYIRNNYSYWSIVAVHSMWNTFILLFS